MRCDPSCPQVHAHKTKKPSTGNVPGKDRLEVVIRHGDDQAIGATQVKHQDHKPPTSSASASRPTSAPTVCNLLAENRCNRGHIQCAGSGDDQEHSEHVRHAPDDLVVHAGHNVAMVFHVDVGSEQPHASSNQAAAPPTAARISAHRSFNVAYAGSCLIIPVIANAGVQLRSARTCVLGSCASSLEISLSGSLQIAESQCAMTGLGTGFDARRCATAIDPVNAERAGFRRCPCHAGRRVFWSVKVS